MNFKHENGISHYQDGEMRVGYILHKNDHGVLSINTVFVNDEFRNQGIASQMMHSFYDYIKENNIKVLPICPYAVTWFKRNKDKQDILIDSYKNE